MSDVMRDADDCALAAKLR